MTIKKIVIVIPVFSEAGVLVQLVSRLNEVMSKLTYSWSIIFVNDGSDDDSLQILGGLARDDQRIKVIDLSRNFGKEIAMTAGVFEAGDLDALICMDADLQHPPELIPQLIFEWENGADIVCTIRVSSDREPLLRKLGSTLFYWLISKVSSLEMIPRGTDFRLYDSRVIREFRRATERVRMFRGIMDWFGFRRSYIEFHADARSNGISKFSYTNLWQLAVNSLTAFSLWPLRVTGYIGVFISCTSFFLLCWMFADHFIMKMWNYTPLAFFMVANTFLIGVVLVAIGLVALYIGTIHTEVINRPMYVIRSKENF
jgi:dolichol-phosphate mannosyltransferase